MLAPTVVHLFQLLDIGLTLWEPKRWREIYERPYDVPIVDLELQYGGESGRMRYNMRGLSEARRLRRTFVAERSGLTDLFVPVCVSGSADAVLVTGPLATSPPTRADISEHWRLLSGRQADLLDPEFLHYLAARLGTLLLEGPRCAEYQRLIETVARLLAGREAADPLVADIRALGKGLLDARLAERMWVAARGCVDARTGRAWVSPIRAPRLWDLGLKRAPEQLIVGLIGGARTKADPLDELLRRDAFQRACVTLARKGGNLAGRIGEHGFTFLSPSRGSEERTRKYLLELAEQASGIAQRRFGLRVHLGLSAGGGSLPEQYPAALAAAEAAVSSGARQAKAGRDSVSEHRLGGLVSELGRRCDEDPRILSTRFERYAEGVTARSGEKLDVAHAYLEMGFQRVVEGLREHGALESRSIANLTTTLERSAAGATTLTELFTLYRRAVNDVVDVLARPKRAPRDHNLRHAEAFIRKHYAERLSLNQVAKLAGYHPNYFSELFRQKYGTPFEEFVISLRIERARQLLASSALTEEALDMRRLAALTGFASRQYFGRLFRERTGETPVAFRRRLRLEMHATASIVMP